MAKRERAPEAAEEPAPEPEPVRDTKRSWMAYVPPTAEEAEPEDDAALAKYNAMLAELTAADQPSERNTAEREHQNVR